MAKRKRKSRTKRDRTAMNDVWLSHFAIYAAMFLTIGLVAYGISSEARNEMRKIREELQARRKASQTSGPRVLGRLR